MIYKNVSKLLFSVALALLAMAINVTPAAAQECDISGGSQPVVIILDGVPVCILNCGCINQVSVVPDLPPTGKLQARILALAVEAKKAADKTAQQPVETDCDTALVCEEPQPADKPKPEKKQ